MSTYRIRIDAVGVGIAAALVATAFFVQSQFTANAQDSSSRVKPQHPPPTPVLDTHDLMELFNRPVFEFLKKSVAKEPADEKAWEEVSNRGLQVAEVANLSRFEN